MPRSPRRAAAGRAKARPGDTGPARLIAFNKPYDVLSQFTDANGRATLADFIDCPGVYPAGRLDRDSEGLLLLTNNGRLNARITQPRQKTAKRYWIQVDGSPSDAQLAALAAGPVIRDGPTRPAEVRIIEAPELWPRHPPVHYRRTVPTTWLEVIITEGRNRQVRRMSAAVGLPTLRLVRMAIGQWALGDLAPGAWADI